MNVIMDFVRATPNVVVENSWIVALILIVFLLGLLVRRIVTSDRRATRINSINAYIDEIKSRETDAG